MYSRFGKRLFDIAASCTAILLLSPLLIFLATGVRLSSPGPSIFRQRRIGRFGEPFAIFKFRSMPVNTDNVPSDQLATVEIRPFGRFIRRTNLDELPQLFNILMGHMSIVGPRPALASQEELLALRHANGALTCAPGLTGLAQVHSYDGMNVAEKARYDGEYAREVTFFADVTIILRTFIYLSRPPPTY